MLTEMADELIFSYFSFAVWAELEIFVVHCRAISFRVYKFFNKTGLSGLYITLGSKDRIAPAQSNPEVDTQ